MLEALLRPRRVVHAHCDLPCGIYDPAQARVEAESVKAIQTRYQDAEKFKTARESVEDYRIARSRQGGARRPGQGAPVGAVDRLLQARAPQKYPQLHELFWNATKEAGLAKKGTGPGAGTEAAGLDRRVGRSSGRPRRRPRSPNTEGRGHGLRPTLRPRSAPGPLPRLTVKDIGLVGVPFSGKSTFTALTDRRSRWAGQPGRGAGTRPSSRRPDPDGAVAQDGHAQVEFVDVPGGTSSHRGSRSCVKPTRSPSWVFRAGYVPPPGARRSARISCSPIRLWSSRRSRGGEADKGANGRPRSRRSSSRTRPCRPRSRSLRTPGLSRSACASSSRSHRSRSSLRSSSRTSKGTDVPDGLPEAVGVYASIEAEAAENGRRRGPGAAGRVRGARARARVRDPRVLPGDRPHHRSSRPARTSESPWEVGQGGSMGQPG